MKEVISNRISLIIKDLGITRNALAVKLDYANSVVLNVTNQRNLPSFEFIYRMKKAIPQLNLNWLIYGEGEMYISQEAPSTDILFYKQMYESCQRENKLLREMNEMLKQSNDSKK